MEQVFDDLYQQTMLDHGKNPRHYGCIDHATHKGECHNRLCGDSIYFTALINDDDIITDIAFESVGCILCKASASLLSEKLINSSRAEALKQAQLLKEEQFTSLMTSYPTREKCFTLPIDAIEAMVTI